jgi:hypothetical protein
VTAKACGKKSAPDTQIKLTAEADTSSLAARLTQVRVTQKVAVRVNGRQWLAQTASRNQTADYRDSFRGNLHHTLKRMSCQTPVIFGVRPPSGDAK